jgi:hypothetical protein
VGLLSAAGLMAPAAVLTAPAAAASEVAITSSGLHPGAIKHVWLIILENKSFDATFSGLNQNTYLWKTLPAQGVLLKNYYGTGHFSMDNYVSLVSGQARPGQKLSFELRAVEATGEGLMRWAPDARNIVAKWDFVVEND